MVNTLRMMIQRLFMTSLDRTKLSTFQKSIRKRDGALICVKNAADLHGAQNVGGTAVLHTWGSTCI